MSKAFTRADAGFGVPGAKRSEFEGTEEFGQIESVLQTVAGVLTAPQLEDDSFDSGDVSEIVTAFSAKRRGA